MTATPAPQPEDGWTKGPWAWFGNAKNREIYLATTHSGRRYVMGFQRWGLYGAQPTFQPAQRGLVPAEELLKFEVGNPTVRGVDQAKADDSVYRLDISGIDCADARLIAAAPEVVDAADDALAGWRYIRAQHGDLPGVGWDRVEQKLTAALAKARGQQVQP